MVAFFLFIILTFLYFLIEFITALKLIILNTIQSNTKHSKLDKHENAILKNCGTRHLNIPETKFPNILLGIANIDIRNSGFMIKFFVFRYFSSILILKKLEIVIDAPSPTIKALTPKYLGKNIMERIIKKYVKIIDQ